MKLLLYVVAFCLAWCVGRQGCEIVLLHAKETGAAAARKGMDEATYRLRLGKGSGQVAPDYRGIGWRYTDATIDWWRIRDCNFLGKLPPTPSQPVWWCSSGR